LPPRVERDEYGRILRIWASARTGEGVDAIRLALEEFAAAATANPEANSSAAA
jgi:GTP-binding protein HflX